MLFKCTVTVLVSGLFFGRTFDRSSYDRHTCILVFFYLTKLQSYWFVKIYKTFNDQHLSLIYLSFNVSPGQWFRQRARDPDQFSGEVDEH